MLISTTKQKDPIDYSGLRETMPRLFIRNDLEVRQFSGKSLGSKELESLTKDLFRLYAEAFLHSPEAVSAHAAEFKADLKSHLAASDRLTVVARGEQRALVCGSVVDSPLGRLYHLAGMIIDPELQGQGLGSLLLKQEVQVTAATILAFHTQSAVMVAVGNKIADICPDLSVAVAPSIGFHHEGTIARRRYGGKPLYGDIGKLRELAVSGIDIDQGDAIFAAGRIRPIYGAK